ncbi:MAG: HupE/UreJ family protein [Terriglobales bacterium]
MKIAAALLLVLATTFAHAHKPSDSYLAIRTDGATLEGQWDIALRDLEYALGLDANGDGAITWGELRARHADVAAYALARLQIRADRRSCALAPLQHLVDQHSDGAYAVLRFSARCEAERFREVEIEYSLVFDLDPTHRGLLRVERPAGTLTAVLGPDQPRFAAPLARVSRLSQFVDYVGHGIWHIWIGFDHVLFLISLLLPAALYAGARGWEPTERFAPVFWEVFKVVTAFTVAHSITLSLAALAVIQLPSRLVESAIALSVLLAALNNLRPLVLGRRWIVAFAFGLVHGFGFASVLADLGLPQDALLIALVGFNAGVEIGQLAIVAVFLPLAFTVRRTWVYQRMLMIGGSAAIALVATVWLLERSLDLRLFPA